MKRITVVVVLIVALLAGIANPASAAADSSTMRVTALIGLNLRTGPGLGYSIITAMPYGSVVSSGEWSGVWVRVTYHGMSGWAHSNWLARTTSSSASDLVPPSTVQSRSGAESSCAWAWGSQVCAPSYISNAIYAAAAKYGVSGSWLMSVAACESGFNPQAVGRAGEIGLFQFMSSTYYAYSSGDIWNVWNQADAAARMFSMGLAGHWTCASLTK